MCIPEHIIFPESGYVQKLVCQSNAFPIGYISSGSESAYWFVCDQRPVQMESYLHIKIKAVTNEK